MRSSGGAVPTDVDDETDADLDATDEDEDEPTAVAQPTETPPSGRDSDSYARDEQAPESTLAVPEMDVSGPQEQSPVDEAPPVASGTDVLNAPVASSSDPIIATTSVIEKTGVIETTSDEPITELPVEPSTFVQEVVDLLGAAIAPVGPAAPPESPLAWAVLAWLRRQSGQESPTAATMETSLTEETTTLAAAAVAATGLPDELERTVLVSGLDQPLDFRILPGDSEHPTILIAEKNGAIKLYHDGQLETLITLPVTTAAERGIGGIEIDPQFATNRYLYVSYTTLEGGINYNRLSRLTLSEDLHSVLAERVILKNSEPNAIHHGGEIRFSPVDGMLYWSTGENSYAPNAQDLSNLHGKIMRIDPNTLEAPADNPFVNTPGARDEIYAYGFRNPFRFTFTPDGKLLVGDVGSVTWEELNLVSAGGNYGWPNAEGNCGSCGYVNPIYAYGHSPLPERAGAITSVLFYTGDALGAEYQNKVFISDYTLGWIKVLTFDEGFTSLIDEQMFDAQAGATVKLEQGPDGNIYQLNIYPGEVSVIAPSGGNRAPHAVITATPDNGYTDLAVQFSGTDSTDPEGSNLVYAWDFGIAGDDDTSTDVAPTWTYTQNGNYLVTLTVTDPEGRVGQTTHRIVVGSTAPAIVGDITVNKTKYDAGDTITFSATAKDAEDGRPGDLANKDPNAYHWTVQFHHADHVHPFRDDIVGTGGSVTIPRDAHNVDTTWYRITLTVTDSTGLFTTKSVDVHPNLVQLQFGSNNPDAVYTIDGVPHKGTYTETAVVGVKRVIAAVTPQYVNGVRLEFGSWSDGSLASHTIVTPRTATSYVVTYDEYVAPKAPDPFSIPTQILKSQAANAQRLVDAFATLGGVVSNAIADVPAGLAHAISEASAGPARIPAIAVDVIRGLLDTVSRATAPVVNAITDVAATEALRLVSVAAALASNVTPVGIAVLNAPFAVSGVLLDSALNVLRAVTTLDEQALLGALDLGRVVLEDELAKQHGLVLGALANMFDDVAAGFAIPLPPTEPGQVPIVSALERTLRIGSAVLTSTIDIAAGTFGGQVGVGRAAADGLQVFLAANLNPENVLDWAVHTLATVNREAIAARLAMQQLIGTAADHLGAAAAD